MTMTTVLVPSFSSSEAVLLLVSTMHQESIPVAGQKDLGLWGRECSGPGYIPSNQKPKNINEKQSS